MKEFDIERKGYNKKEVENYIANLKNQYEDEIEKSKQEAMQAQAELMQCKMELDSYHKKDDQISNALVVAVETAKEIESSAKTIYELEIKRVKVLYKKWNNILNEVKALYPNINKVSGISVLFDEFEEALNKILSKEVELSQMPSSVNKTAEKIYAKTLLSRMWGNNQNNAYYKNSESTENPTVKRIDIDKKRERKQENNNFQVQNKKSNLLVDKEKNDFENEGDFEKFLKSEFDDFDNFQYKTSHKDADISPDQKSNYLAVLEQSLSKSAEKPDDDKFDMLEALQPKEDLMDIMKSFNLDD